MRSDIVPGGVFPDYALPDHTGTVRSLSELQGRDPMILTLARGNYCPKEHRQHLELAEHYPEITVAYTQVVTISTDEHHTSQEFRSSVGAQWPFLSDPGRTVQKDLDIAEYTDPDNDPMIPHTLVLSPGLIVYSVYNGYWFWGRPSFYDLWHDLRAAMAQSRPDWDLSTPGLREAWNAGDYSKFHGWDRRPPAPKAAMTESAAAGLIPASHADLLERPLYGHLATIRPDGGVQVNTMWFLYDGEMIGFTHTRKRQKYRNLMANPTMAMSVNDQERPYRYLEVRGVLDHVEDDPEGAFFQVLSRRYGQGGQAPPDAPDRVVLVMRPTATSRQ